MHLLFKAAAAALMCGGMAGGAHAVAVVGGTTAIRVTADLAGLGLTAGLTGGATLDTSIPEIARILIPITGGSLDPATLAGTIEHAGSGVTLTAGGDVLGLSNFVIDTTASLIRGDVSANGASIGADLPLFSFSLAGLTPEQITNTLNPPIPLFLTDRSAAALTLLFGAPNLAGQRFGLAATAPVLAVVPEPTTWAMLIAGFGMVGIAMRRRSAMARRSA